MPALSTLEPNPTSMMMFPVSSTTFPCWSTIFRLQVNPCPGIDRALKVLTRSDTSTGYGALGVSRTSGHTNMSGGRGGAVMVAPGCVLKRPPEGVTTVDVDGTPVSATTGTHAAPLVVLRSGSCAATLPAIMASAAH